MPADHFGTLVYYCLAADRARARALARPFVPRNRVDDATLEACTAFEHPNLWSWRDLIGDHPGGPFTAVFVGDEDGHGARGAAASAFRAAAGL